MSNTPIFCHKTNPSCPDLPVPEQDGNMKYSSDSEHSDITVVAGDDAYKSEENDQPVPLTQAELNDMRQDLNLSKESAQLLGSHLQANIYCHQEHFTGIESMREN